MSIDRNSAFKKMISELNRTEIKSWEDIDGFLAGIKGSNLPPSLAETEFNSRMRKGIGFLTYDYGIDGVSIEMAKYAVCFEKMFSDEDGNVPPLHFIGGDFYDKAEAVLKPRWKRFEIKGINGWSKWYDGKWFSKLYYEDMPEDSAVSDEVAQEMWRQAAGFAETLGGYIAENEISLLFPVNIFSNPGNFAVALAGIIVSEMMGLYVFASNHDYYWEGGAPASERKDGEKGPRDHFFKNMNNRPFFELFRKMYPWNGAKWVQVNINTQQSDELESTFGFDRSRLFELSTSISDDFFAEYTDEDVRKTRLTMAHILSDGKPVISPLPVKNHLANLADWMAGQKPVVCGNREGLELDLTNEKITYCLQPTRIIARKRIEKDLHLIKALMTHEAFSAKFADDPDRTLFLHITGPVPIEHQKDLETVLNAYLDLCESLPSEIADRIFIGFSVGTENHPSLEPAGLKRLHIEDIYRLATVILFPSETEGRGLPIIEASACGIPIVCSRYYPEEVFAEVVGEHLSPEKQIIYTLFPEDSFADGFLDEVTSLMFAESANRERIEHNKNAVMERYGTAMLIKTFKEVLNVLR